MRILLLVPVPPNRTSPSGLASYLHAVLAGLVEEGHDVTIVTPAGPDDAEREAVTALRREGHRVEAVPRYMGDHRWRRRLRMARRWAIEHEPWRTVWFAEPAVQPLLDRLLTGGEIDLVNVQDSSMATYHLGTSVPHVLTELEVRPPRAVEWRPGAPRGWARWAYREIDWARWRRYQRSVWARFDAVQVFTERDALGACRLAPGIGGRLHVTPFGIEIQEIRGAPVVDPNTIAFIGNYTHAPNVDAASWLAQEILPRVLSVVPDARLRLAGAHAPDAIRALASPSVEVWGLVADADEFMARAAVVAAPVRIGGGMRVKVLHAMGLGKAVVTTTRGAEGIDGMLPLPVIVEDGVDEIASAIARLLLDDDERLRMGAAARALIVERFSAAAFARRSAAVFAAAISVAGERCRA